MRSDAVLAQPSLGQPQEPSLLSASQPQDKQKQDPPAAKPKRQTQPKSKPNARKGQGDKPVDRKPAAPVPAKRINEIFAFVGKHHPEIRPLLRSLQRNRQNQFQAAMRVLDREVRLLQALEEKSTERYQRSLQLWIIRSKTKLVAAQFAMAKNDRQANELKKKMAALLNEHYDIRRSQLKTDIENSKKRVTKLEKQMRDLQSQRKKEIDRQIDTMTRNAERIKRKQRQSGPAEKNKPVDKSRP